MKKVLTLLVGVLAASSVFAAADISFTLDQNTEAVNLPLFIAPDDALAIVPVVGFLPEPQNSASVASAFVPLPEPTTATLVLLSFAACGLRKFRQRR